MIFALETWEMASYVVTVVGLPMAMVIFVYEQRKERQNEEEELFQRLSDEYAGFLKLLLENADLKLLSNQSHDDASGEHKERKRIIFDILVSLFERAFILVYEDDMSGQTKRLWSSWEDYIRDWCKRRDFRDSLDYLLQGEDPDFVKYMRTIASQEAKRPNTL